MRPVSTLPAANSVPQGFELTLQVANDTGITIARTGADTLNGAAANIASTLVRQRFVVISDGTLGLGEINTIGDTDWFRIALIALSLWMYATPPGDVALRLWGRENFSQFDVVLSVLSIVLVGLFITQTASTARHLAERERQNRREREMAENRPAEAERQA